MTIENQERRIVYDTDGTSLDYPAPFPFLEPEWLEVSVGTGEIGTADTPLVYGVDYDVTGAGGAGGGMVILHQPLPVGQKLVISRWVPLTQEEVYPEGGKFPAQTTEDCFDKLTMIAQQLQDIAERSDFLPASSTGDASDVVTWMSEQVTAAENSAAAAATSEANAATSAEAAAISEARAEEAIVDAENAIAIAETSASAAATSAAGALGSETRAYEWAQNPENVSVRENPDTGEDEYSAYHWAKKAAVGTVPTATEADEGVVRFGTAAEHAAGLNGVAAQPGRVRDMLFDGTTLKSSILPVATPTTPGIAQPDGSTITVDGAGVISSQVGPSDPIQSVVDGKLGTEVYDADAPKRVLASGRINNNGSIAYGINIASCTVLGTGRRSITMMAAASSTNYQVFATIDGGANLNINNVINFTVDSKATFRIGVYAGSSVWADQPFNFNVVGN